MEVACHAFFPPAAAAAAVPAELQALRDASPVRAVLKKHLVDSLFAHALMFYSGDCINPKALGEGFLRDENFLFFFSPSLHTVCCVSNFVISVLFFFFFFLVLAITGKKNRKKSLSSCNFSKKESPI
jgi:hypothetical protein